LGHATAGNNEKIQEIYDDFRKDIYNSLGSDNSNSHITMRAMVNSHEDFAETFAYYSQNKELIDKEIESKSENLFSPTLLKKFEFMRDNLWK
jgi:general stress protein 26